MTRMHDHGERVPVPLNDWVNGQLSADVAQIVFTACELTPPAEPLCIVELDASGGLFAKLFLDAFKLSCRSLRRDYYDRLTYIAADSSPELIEQWRSSSVFAGHSDHFQTRVLRADEGLPADIQPTVVIWNADPATSIAQTDAVQALSRLLTQLGEHGFILVNDYAAAEEAAHLAVQSADERGSWSEPAAIHWSSSRAAISHSVAAALDTRTTNSSQPLISALLERRLEELGATVLRASAHPNAPVQSLIFTLAPLPEVALAFERYFGATTRMATQRARSLAREHIQAGRRSEALESYKQCLASSPWDWTLLGEVSEFLNREVRDYTSALAFARAAISLNPISSTWLWNLFGDAFFRLGRWSEAYESYLRAERIDPNDARTNAGLAESYLQQQQLDDALQAIARGLSRDVTGTYRERLLETQRAVLARIAAQALQGAAATPRSYERLPTLAKRGTGTQSEPS